MTHLSVTARWGDVVLGHAIIRQPILRRSVVRARASRFRAIPFAPAVCVCVGSGRVEVRDGAEVRCLLPGEEIVLFVDRMEIRLSCSDEALPLPGRPPIDRRLAACHLAAAAGVALGLGACGMWMPPLGEVEYEQAERLEYIQIRLAAAAEREDAEAETEQREGGTGSRAKGEEGPMGQANLARYGVAGPADPHVARQVALADAAEFGMIGLASAAGFGAGGGRAPIAGARAPASKTKPMDVDTFAGERFTDHGINPPTSPAEDPISTFAVDVDTGSYAIMRRMLLVGATPAAASVRAEELMNYFDYGYASPADGDTFAAHLHAAPSPFERDHHLVRVGIQAKRIPPGARRPAHLVYLVDTSGSMQSEDKLGLAQESLRMLTRTLRSGDTVALCTYAGSVREILPPTGIERREAIIEGIDALSAAGSTAMQSGLELAYRLAERGFVAGHINRVIVLSDGDANVGATDHDTMLRTIDAQRKRGITLSTVGFGAGRYDDTMMERLADEGDGNYRYIDGPAEAKRVFVEQVDSMLDVVARDVKVQVQFDPSVVESYRLIGYENRDVADEDFRDDSVDGGEIGAGHQVTALYDVVFHRRGGAPPPSWITVSVRHKPADGGPSSELAFSLTAADVSRSFDTAPANMRFAAAVGGLAEILRESPYASEWAMADVSRIARQAAADMQVEHRAERDELVELVERAQAL